MNDTPLAAALGYAAHGLSVVADHTPRTDGTCDCHHDDCDDIGKHGRTLHGVKDATTDPDRIRHWWSMWRAANVGIAAGAGLTVLDVDPRNAGDASLDRLIRRHGALPVTPTVKTGGRGWHLYFAGDVSSSKLEKRGYPGLDVIGSGLHVVAPPSLHKSGRRYVWQAGRSLDDLPLAPLPTWLMALCDPRPSGSSFARHPQATLPLGQAALRFVFRGAPVGQQRMASVAAARNLLSFGYAVDDVIALVWQGLQRSEQDAARRGWTPGDVEYLVHSIAASPPPPVRPLRSRV